MKTQTTKERILEAAEDIMLERGFHSVGLNQILKAVNVPKGSFYHYFDSKEQFGVEMIRHYLAITTAFKQKKLNDPTQIEDPIQRLFTYFEGGIEYIGQLNGKFPCLIAKLASEITDLSEPMRIELKKGFEAWIGLFKALLDEAVEQKKLPANTNTQSYAELIQDLWSGATQRAVINRDTEPLTNATGFIKNLLKTLPG